MHPQLSPIRASAAMLLVTSVAAAITASQIVIDQTWITCSFDINTTISEDLTWTIDISTKNSSVDSFAAIGDGANETDARRECYGGSRIYSTGNISEINFGDWDVKGSISLSKGLTAKVALAVYWVFDREEASAPAESIWFSGPTLNPQPFSHRLNKTRAENKPGYCTGLEENKRTFYASDLALHFIFEIEKSAEADAGARGRIGEKTDGALLLSSKMTIQDGCSRKNPPCLKDRTGFEVCSNYDH